LAVLNRRDRRADWSAAKIAHSSRRFPRSTGVSMANDWRSRRDIWAVVPVKEFARAKQRLAAILLPRMRQELAVAMFEDVIEALSASRALAGIVVVTVDPTATAIALRYGAKVWTDAARDGHTGAVTSAACRLAANGSAMLTMPGDIPRVTAADVAHVLAAHAAGAAFTIVPAWDERGSNAIVCSPADLVPLRFGPDSFFPHLSAARAAGVKPTIVRNDAISFDLDEPAELTRFIENRSRTRAWELLDRHRPEWDTAPAVVEAQ
jgi:2-phospho-L-lactate guanylyltransferase